ncbi:N-acetylmuramoyl-L-alanine amidase [Peribacillus deserti]|uniref:N-acetylmuramoyl-L-alanine amidase n=1 Tax=Peribacillus deserti TaxID=673318 RepID=A0A2N5M5S3_9BACI|nr:N-acetylmuramoyl-L-alanine amidase [Peribacillus deserti]PLT29714.1 N-acetylmuramoyl-L-alanine amidase [Peribacillus deserti]
MKRTIKRFSLIAALFALTGTAFVLPVNTSSLGLSIPKASASEPSIQADSIQQAFKKAAQEFNVPESILLSVSYNLSRWEHHNGKPSTAGGYGIMHLTSVIDHSSAKGDEETADVDFSDESFHTLEKAAKILNLSPEALKQDPVQNIRGAAALLAEYAEGTAGGLPENESEWYGAVAKYSGSDDSAIALDFADQVYQTINQGEARETLDGQKVQLAAEHFVPNKSTADSLKLKQTNKDPETEAPNSLKTQFIPAFYQQLSSNPGNYTNYDVADRPNFGPDIRYIVLHDTEVGYDPTLMLFARSYAASSHYVIRSSDGHITQMIKNKDVAWHAGNWYFNMHSIGLEHEGFALKGATWFTEQMYRMSASLVKYLAEQYDIPLDRAHIIGHDEVPGLAPLNQSRMHSDPATFWDWEHYMELLGAPITPSHGSRKMVTLKPHFQTNEQYVDVQDGNLRKHPSNFVYLYTAPSFDAPYFKDAALPNAGAFEALNWGNKFKAGQTFASAGQEGDWSAIWYSGKKAWFYNPDGKLTVPGKTDILITPKEGKTSIPVYGSAYPEAAAYPADIPYKSITPLQYTIGEGQVYAAEEKVKADYYNAKVFTLTPYGVHKMVYGNEEYYRIHFNHRYAFVKAADVDIINP